MYVFFASGHVRGQTGSETSLQESRSTGLRRAICPRQCGANICSGQGTKTGTRRVRQRCDISNKIKTKPMNRVRVLSRLLFPSPSSSPPSSFVYISHCRTSNHHEPTHERRTHVDTRSFVQNFLIEDPRAKLPGLTVRTGASSNLSFSLLSRCFLSIERGVNFCHGTHKVLPHAEIVRKEGREEKGKRKRLIPVKPSRRGRSNVVAKT